ncbi:nickel-dependent lactate racemase [Paenibacillus turpanensis]|uniref:nickel-dependent lactate racemase n=1 Tax=Paenibacillus turpanensis TaxID=2689078 RepID=UPI00140E5B84|nr:nickel-dependent lactate racemase [Paenibacillus turpanensis]
MLLGYGRNHIQLSLLEGVPSDTIAYRGYRHDPGIHPEVCTDEERLRLLEALQQPYDSPLLRALAVKAQNAVILVSDITRLCPTHKFLPMLLDELNAGGIADDCIHVVVALGAHRRLTDQEIRRLAGEEAYRRVSIVNHSARSEDCSFIGVTSKGTPVEINRIVAMADLRIATGNIEPHRLVGMSGGVKALVPGAASVKTIESNHSLSSRYQITPGDPNNPIHQDLEEAQSMLPIHFLYNTVVDHQRKVLFAVSGNILEAHRRGVVAAKGYFLVPVHKSYDVVIASAGGYPKDMQLYQAIKTLQNASTICKPGGTIVLIAKCEELYGNGTFQTWAETWTDQQKALDSLKETFVLGAHKLEHIHKVTKEKQVLLVSDVAAPQAELLGFKPVYPDDCEQEIKKLLESFSSPEVAVMPCGSITFPVTGPSSASS